MSSVLQLVSIVLIIVTIPYLLHKHWKTYTETSSLENDEKLFNSTSSNGTVVSDSNFRSHDDLPIFDQTRYDELSTFLIHSSIIDDEDVNTPDIILTPGTPQNSALRWLVDYDDARLDHENDGPALLERYALAVFYSSTYGYVETTIHPGETWWHSKHWMSSHPICSWYGVKCLEDGSVQQLSLKKNNIRGSLPSELALLSRCESMDLGQNQLTGKIPTALAGMNQLYGLFLEDNQLTGTIPNQFWTAGHVLQEIFVGTNQISGNVPDLPPNCKLQALGLEDNQLTGTIPTSLWSQATELRTLYLEGNALTGTLPNLLDGSLLSLQDLRLRRNQLGGRLPASLFQKMRDLKILHLDSNRFEGDLFSTAWKSLSQLEELHLYQNKFTGPIPPAFTSPSMEKLKFLFIDNNRFTGTIPDKSSSKMLSLKAWYIFGNQLTGPLPKQILASLQDTLQEFQFQDNRLTGTIPTEMGLLTALQRVVGDSNRLQGSLPMDFGRLRELETIRLSNNALQGDFPNDELCFLPKLKLIVVDCDDDETNATITNCHCCRDCSI